ncbi:MAG: hypothetical protein NC187_02620 [Candidatus Amulumruptor caecigallinarius]|nr:hypothetical protein [Candidatus Amulumruptor caecigallinarius]MCM1396370.1 hypothetical protein [Candidatus Amulumruptor caecigallinarius]MCM1453688.1 hypothetical protein [bacterium]
MKKIVALLLIAVAALAAYSQSASGRYVSRMTRDGTLFFVNPQKLTRCTGISKVDYDMTFLTWTDSVTVNFTFRTKVPYRPDSLRIDCCGTSYPCSDYSLLFTDIVKGGYEIRVTSRYPVADIGRMLECAESPVIAFTQDGAACSAAYSKGAWASDRKKLLDIYNLYLLTR